MTRGPRSVVRERVGRGALGDQQHHRAAGADAEVAPAVVATRVLFLASRGEQHLPVLVVSALVGSVLTFTDFIIAAKMIIVVIWVGAAVSKMNLHFENVVPPMVSNAPFVPGFVKRLHYRSIPDDLKPSKVAWFMAHIMGTLAELAVPLVLLLSPWPWLTLVAVGCMVLFQLFITQTFPLAVPLEWNILFAYITICLFAGYNANYVGGDIVTGAKDLRQLVFGPRITASPYTVGVPGTYICSAATPPGPGAHGMCGYNAARLALSKLGR